MHAAVAASGLMLLAAAPAATATTVFGGTLRSAAAADRTCSARLLDGARGTAVRRVTSADTGVVRVRLGARRGNWDVAVFDARSGRLVAASSKFGARELAQGFVHDGQRLAVQACRRSGRARKATADVRTIALPAPTGEKIRLVRVKAKSHAERTRLASSEFDLTEHGGDGYLDVLAHGDDDLRRLREQKFSYEVLIPDVVAADRATLRTTAPSPRSSPGDGTPLEDRRADVMPSGRVAYRHLHQYEEDMQLLVARYGPNGTVDPGYVRPIRLKHQSLEGRWIHGIEIAKDVAADDGRPVFLQMGVHHAREWPSGEHAIEFGFDLLDNRDETDLRLGSRSVDVESLLAQTRTVIVPIVNPDGFDLSREAAVDAQQGRVPGGEPDPRGLIPHSLAYKRKNCRIGEGLPEPGACAAAASNAGVDPNRNYGALWGGPGASDQPLNETYWGAGPFSEPETQNIRDLVSRRQVVALITNHTYSDLVLRPPGLKAQGAPYDEDSHYKPLGDAMAAENGYTSQPSYALYDTTGTTEDWSYSATGGLGFTFEIGKGEGVALTGAGFHPVYPVGVVAEYYGKGRYAGRGNRSAYFRALEWAATTANHALIRGTGKPGSTLRLAKSFTTLTSPRPAAGTGTAKPIAFTDALDTSTTVGEDGRFSWHVNPSTRPAVAQGVPGRVVKGPPSAPRTFKTSGASFAPGAGADVPGTYEDVPFDIPAEEDNGATTLRIEYPFGSGSASDLDLRVYRKVGDGWEELASSTSDNSSDDATVPCSLAGRTGACKFEQAVVPDLGSGEFKFRVENWLSTSTDWVARMTFAAPVAKRAIPPAEESWTLTCSDRHGRLLGRRNLTIDRGEARNVGNVCKRRR